MDILLHYYARGGAGSQAKILQTRRAMRPARIPHAKKKRSPVVLPTSSSEGIKPVDRAAQPRRRLFGSCANCEVLAPRCRLIPSAARAMVGATGSGHARTNRVPSSCLAGVRRYERVVLSAAMGLRRFALWDGCSRGRFPVARRPSRKQMLFARDTRTRRRFRSSTAVARRKHFLFCVRLAAVRRRELD